MSKAVITSYTLLDFMSEADMDGFFFFVESNMEQRAAKFRANGMTKFYISWVFNKGDKFAIGNWLGYENQKAFLAYDKIWQEFLKVSSNNFDFITKNVPCRRIARYDFS